MLANAVASAALNVLVLVAIPLFFYFLYHRLRHRRSFAEVARRSGLQLGDKRYLLYSALFAAVTVSLLLIWSPPLEPFLRSSSPQRFFKGLGFGGLALTMALIYGVVKTGFSEEFLFRGLLAGSLSRRLPLVWANVVQAVIFLLPHLLILRTAPELSPVLVLAFFGALFKGWVRIRSDSILGPWLVDCTVEISSTIRYHRVCRQQGSWS